MFDVGAESVAKIIEAPVRSRSNKGTGVDVPGHYYQNHILYGIRAVSLHFDMRCLCGQASAQWSPVRCRRSTHAAKRERHANSHYFFHSCPTFFLVGSLPF